MSRYHGDRFHGKRERAQRSRKPPARKQEQPKEWLIPASAFYNWGLRSQGSSDLIINHK